MHKHIQSLSNEGFKVDKTLKEIHEAEIKAEQIIAKARQKAEKIISHAKEESIAIFNTKSKALSHMEKEVIAEKMIEIKNEKRMLLRKAYEDTLSLEKKAQKNHEKAVQYVLKSLFTSI